MADIQAKLQEEKILKAIRAKRRFKAAVRHVIYNISWMQEDDDEEETDPINVKQAVSRLTRKKKVTKGLTIKEKAIMRKHLDYRTDAEKEHLNKIIGGMKCFRMYPEHVQLELVGVTYFEYYGPGRVLIRQNDEGHALYFLLTGEVLITRTQWDEVVNEYTEVELCKLSAGNMFGEISLLHNVPRTATCTTTAPCELLVLKRKDFDRVLKASLMQIWDEIKDAMGNLMYFDHLNNVAKRECCMLSKMKTYAPNDIVFGDMKDKKKSTVMTFFIIEGQCSVVEHLFIQEANNKGIKSFKLYEIPEPVVHEPSSMFGSSGWKLLEKLEQEELLRKEEETLKQAEEQQADDIPVKGTTTEEPAEVTTEENKIPVEEGEEPIEIITETGEVSKEVTEEEGKVPSEIILEEGKVFAELSAEEGEVPVEEDEIASEITAEPGEVPSEITVEEGEMSVVVTAEVCGAPSEVTAEGENPVEVTANVSGAPSEVTLEESEAPADVTKSEYQDVQSEEDEIKRLASFSEYRKLIRRSTIVSLVPTITIPSNVNIHFMQVCVLGPKATFVGGSLMKNRRVIALTPVKCLLIPSYWLMRHNYANIWTRIEQFVNSRIPTTQQIFKKYMQNKKWREYRKKLLADVLSQRKFYNSTTIHDVPYSIRVVSDYNNK